MITADVYDTLVEFRNGPVRRPDGATPMIEYLTAKGYIQVIETEVFPGLTIRPIAWEITISGEIALSEFEEASAKKAKDEKQQRFQNKISVASVLIPLITFILGLMVEHFYGIIGIIFEVLH